MTAPNAPETPQGPHPQSAGPVEPPTQWTLPAEPAKPPREIKREILTGAALVLGSALVGLLFGLLWHTFAPKVPLYSDGSAVYLRDPEGEQQIAADGTFAIIGACFGIVAGVIAYLITKKRHGGISVPIGLTLGGLAASWIAWQLGIHLDSKSIIALAQSTKVGQNFPRPLALGAKSTLVVWPMAALLTLVAATSLFTPRDGHPEAEAAGSAPARSQPEE
ncbi:hypothetical protein [Streptacidiphilus fuscans]|uniref:hypothetical protein n=1 Tax=Streptacidiphilus fuscans TaxID=2789292 RepID=UPI002E28A1A0|nr:hypothetical protein [Streptacidiphilus fuscans]